MRLPRIFLLVSLWLSALVLKAQDSAKIIQPVPEQYIKVVSQKVESIEEKLDKKSQKALDQYKKQEAKIIKKLSRLDSSAAKQLLETSKFRFQQLEEKLKNPGKLSQYIPGLDSLSTSLNFLQANNFSDRRLLFQALCVAGTLGSSLHLAPIHSTFS